ncbi:MAG: hypothetical protein FWD41_01630 [Actinomycetia bacterium]|nr:hypothetical protein [Actinomycetes bacterium]
MAIQSKAEALAFIQAMQLTVKGKKGFTWLTNELDELYAYVEGATEDDRQLTEESA